MACIFQDGESIPTNKKCYSKICTYDSLLDMFVMSETQVQCRRLDELPVCQGVSIIVMQCKTNMCVHVRN